MLWCSESEYGTALLTKTVDNPNNINPLSSQIRTPSGKNVFIFEDLVRTEKILLMKFFEKYKI